MIIKQEKDIIRKEIYRPVSLTNIDVEILDKTGNISNLTVYKKSHDKVRFILVMHAGAPFKSQSK